MEFFLTYLKVFLVGGFICLLAQVLIIKTKITSARILVLFVAIGAVLEALGLYEPLINFASAGATVPITGFGRNLAKGAIDGVKEMGFLGAFAGGLGAVAAGVACAVVAAFIVSLIFNSKTKKS